MNPKLTSALLTGLLAATVSVAGAADTIEQPTFKPGDRWTYHTVTEKGQSWSEVHDEFTLTRATATTLFYTVKPSGSTQTPKELLVGIDWSRIRDVNGKETVVNRPLAFPLSAGKSWEVSYEEQHPNAAHRSERLESKYVVQGYEDVEVPAGKFHALKIEAEGRWHAEMEPGQAVTQGARTSEQSTTMVTQVQKTAPGNEATGRLYKAVWYVPEVGRWVKSVEEYYSAGGVRYERYSQELESYKRAE